MADNVWVAVVLVLPLLTILLPFILEWFPGHSTRLTLQHLRWYRWSLVVGVVVVTLNVGLWLAVPPFVELHVQMSLERKWAAWQESLNRLTSTVNDLQTHADAWRARFDEWEDRYR